MTLLTVYKRTINRAVIALGGLHKGQFVDLLMDNHPEIRDCDHARTIIKQINPDTNFCEDCNNAVSLDDVTVPSRPQTAPLHLYVVCKVGEAIADAFKGDGS